MKYIIFVCPECGRSVKINNPSSYQPNTICACKMPEYCTVMVMVTPPKIQDESKEVIEK